MGRAYHDRPPQAAIALRDAGNLHAGYKLPPSIPHAYSGFWHAQRSQLFHYSQLLHYDFLHSFQLGMEFKLLSSLQVRGLTRTCQAHRCFLHHDVHTCHLLKPDRHRPAKVLLPLCLRTGVLAVAVHPGSR